MNFYQKSRQVILDHQMLSGAFIASPAFAHYKYCWLRDGAFIAYGLDLIGDHLAAERFYRWGSRAIERYRHKASHVIDLVNLKKDVPLDCFLHARYTVDGLEVEGEWGTFQLDGYGAWLWGLAQHVKITGNEFLYLELMPSIELVVRYLLATWGKPGFDCWEENGHEVHFSTIAAIYGGIAAVREQVSEELTAYADKELGRMKNYLFQEGIKEGHFTKSVESNEIDASLLWLHVPFALVDPNHPVMLETVRLIEERLLYDGGLHRYPQDVYYGGGQWILLSAWLGWHYIKLGKKSEALAIKYWIEQQFDSNGYLPEQVAHHLLHPDHYLQWNNQLGSSAKPLLWSHAMYLILCHKIQINMGSS
jgi:GH15 family glucan-1,4-alpha-glucosidase